MAAPDRLSRLAARFVLTISVLIAAVEVGRVGLERGGSALLVAVLAAAAFLPLHLGHLRYGLRGERPPRPALTLGAMVAVHAVALVLIGPAWSLMLATLATSALVALSPARAALFLVGCMAAPAVVTAARGYGLQRFGGADSAYLAYSVAFRAVLQFSLVWMTAAVTQLRASREALAADAAQRERDRLEAEVRLSLEANLGGLERAGEQARSALSAQGVAPALIALDRVLGLSRRALEDLRRIVAEARTPHGEGPAERLATAARERRTPVGRALVHRRAWTIAAAVAGVTLAFPLLIALGAFGFVVATRPPVPAVLAYWLPLAALHATLVLDLGRGRAPRRPFARWAAAVVLAVVGLAVSGLVVWTLLWFAAAAGLAVFRGRMRVAVSAATLATMVVLDLIETVSHHPGPVDLVWEVPGAGVIAVLTVAATYASARLVEVVGALERTRDDLAAHAVRTERRRLSSDLHDLLGQSLTAISLKGDLARRLVQRDRAAAAHELDELVTLAAAQAAEIESVARGEREVAFVAEAEQAVALLRTAGVAVDARLEPGALPPATSTLLGWVMREGVTNVLRHARARHCTVRAVRSGDEVVLELVNDGAHGRPGDGTGLRGLADRLAAESGVVESGALGDGRFRLLVRVPA